MKNYQEFDAEKFAGDQEFRDWIFNPNVERNIFWENWITQNPQKESDVRQAKRLLEVLDHKYKDRLSDEDLNEDIALLVDAARRNNGKRSSLIKKSAWLWRAAAGLVITAGLTWLYFSLPRNQSVATESKHNAMEKGLKITKTNNGKSEMTILLSDKSVATLMPGSSLSYPARFTGSERQVNLVGEAFFDVAKDAQKPFLVYANETVTKVLGTSFRVRAFEKDPDVTILVKTGRVSVYPLKEYKHLSDPNDREVTGVVLQPNQQVVFKKKESRLEKGIVANPGLLVVSSDNADMIFDEKPVSEIIRYLENIYGIIIVFDEESLASCVVSTQFNEENLKQRLSVICQAIGATYEIIDGQIIINSKGCGS